MSDRASGRVFDVAADSFAMLSTPSQPRILRKPCEGEKNVSQFLQKVDVRQPHVSQHLGVLYRGGVPGRRRAGARLAHHDASSQALKLCGARSSGRQALHS